MYYSHIKKCIMVKSKNALRSNKKIELTHWKMHYGHIEKCIVVKLKKNYRQIEKCSMVKSKNIFRSIQKMYFVLKQKKIQCTKFNFR